MVVPTFVRAGDLHALVGLVDADRPDLPAEGLPPSLLVDLTRQIRCDLTGFVRFDPAHQTSSGQLMADGDDTAVVGWPPMNWQHYWHCQMCSYPDRTGDLLTVVKTADFYSVRQRHSVGTRFGINRPMSFKHALMLTLPAPSSPLPALSSPLPAPSSPLPALSSPLPAPSSPLPAPDATMRLFFLRGPGADFSERDQDLLTLLRPHLHMAFLKAESRRHPVPRLTPRQTQLLRLVAAGHTNTKIARQLGISEGTVRIHLENIYTRLNVSSRMAAVNRAFPMTVRGAALAAGGRPRPRSDVR